MNDQRQMRNTLHFTCQCGQAYSAPPDMANEPLECHACHNSFLIPRPVAGYYAAPAEAQIKQAKLFGLPFEGLHRGKLAEMLAKSRKVRKEYEHGKALKAARENSREASTKEFRREFIESEFTETGSCAEPYHKPTRKQFNQIYKWLDENKPHWEGDITEVLDAIDKILPELKKSYVPPAMALGVDDRFLKAGWRWDQK